MNDAANPAGQAARRVLERYRDYNVAAENDYTIWTVLGIHWQISGAFAIAVIAVLVGVACYLYCRIIKSAFFM